MAVLIPGKLCYLGNPRTGTSAVHAALTKKQFPDIRMYSQHATLVEIPHWKDELAFTSIRNPYDVLVIWWVRMGPKQEGVGGFLEFIQTYENKDFIRNGKLFYCCEDRVETIRQENLQAEFDAMLARVEIPPIALGRVNPSGKKKPWRTYYSTPEIIEAANLLVGDEADRWNYDRLV